MIFVIIGGSCCGKTSFAKNTWLKNKEIKVKKDILYYTETDDVILIGKYSNIDGRERSGTDTISRSQIHLLSEQVGRLTVLNKDIVLEGDKVAFRSVLNQILNIGEVRLIMITSNIDIIIDRYLHNGSKSSISSIKSSRTKSINIYREYSKLMNGIIIDTSFFTDEDFKTFSLWNLDDYLDKKDYTKTLF